MFNSKDTLFITYKCQAINKRKYIKILNYSKVTIWAVCPFFSLDKRIFVKKGLLSAPEESSVLDFGKATSYFKEESSMLDFGKATSYFKVEKMIDTKM